MKILNMSLYGLDVEECK